MTRHGFTLIELLLVIGMIAVIASIVLVAIKPSKLLEDAKRAQRAQSTSLHLE